MTAILTMGRIFRGRWLATAGLCWLILVALAAIFAPLVAPYDPLELDPLVRLSPPSLEHLFGTDHYGRDSFSRSLYGARMAIIIGIGSVVVALVAGGLAGMVSAYFNRLGHVIMRVVDVLMAFPALLLALVLMTLLERSVVNTVIVIGIVYATTTARILFGMTLKLKGEVFVDAATCSGAGHASILFRHILPNSSRRSWCRQASSSPLPSCRRRRSTSSASACRRKCRAGATCCRNRAFTSPAPPGCCCSPAR